MSEELKSCPFCGYQASITQVESAIGGGRNTYIVGCNSEECDVSFHGHARKVDAAKAWNARTSDKQLASAVAVIKHYANKCKCGHSVNAHGAMLACSRCICGLFSSSNNKAAVWLKENGYE